MSSSISKVFQMRFRVAWWPCAVHVAKPTYSDLERRLIRGNIGVAVPERNRPPRGRWRSAFMEQPLKSKETQCKSNKFTKTRASSAFAVVPEPGEEVMDCLKRFVASDKIGAGRVPSRPTISLKPPAGGGDRIRRAGETALSVPLRSARPIFAAVSDTKAP